MALADYFRKSAVAASQVVAGFDEAAIRERLDQCDVGVMIGNDAQRSPEGLAATDTLVRLIARFYPRISFQSNADIATWVELARSINPEIEIHEDTPQIGVAVGIEAPRAAALTISIGSDGWDATLSTTELMKVGNSLNPFGAGIAACLGAANLFRVVMLGSEARLDQTLVFSGLHLEPGPTSDNVSCDVILNESCVLVGLGAIGNGAAWALGRCPGKGTIHLVDPQRVELSNLQRYVLTDRSSDGEHKLDVATTYFSGSLVAESHKSDWAAFVEGNGYSWDRVLVALDSAKDRRAIQSSLPRWIANAWTQPGDLGVSVHPSFNDNGACLGCLYLPKGRLPNEDRVIARALGLGEEHELAIRQLLYDNAPAPPEMLKLVASNLQVPDDDVLLFSNRTLRELYSEGICGGAVLPLDRVGMPTHDVHVPLAHQSALAGIGLASRLVADSLGYGPTHSEATRINLMDSVTQFPTQPLAKDPRGICVCQDETYIDAYRTKY
jgi:hypothetical protein